MKNNWTAAVKDKWDNDPVRFFAGGVGVILTVALAYGVWTGGSTEEQNADIRDRSLAELQAKVPADCGVSYLGIFRPTIHQNIDVVMVRCETRATETIIQKERGKTPRQIITPYLQNEVPTDGR